MGNPQALQTTDVVDFRTDQRLSRGTRAFLKALNTPMPPELEKLAPIAARNVLETAQASVNVDYSGIDEREKTITVDGFQIALNIVRPKGAAGTLPVFVLVHGGGWVLGDYPTHRRLVRDLIVESGYAGSSSTTRAHPTPSFRGRSMKSTPRPSGSPNMGTRSTSTAGTWPSSATALAAT